MDRQDHCNEIFSGSFCCSLILFLFVGLPLILVYKFNAPNPIFSVESTSVKAYNLTANNGLFCIINLGVRVRNPNPKKHTLEFKNLDMEVRKGNHHGLANDALHVFSVGPTGEAVVVVEAVGLRVHVGKKIVRELVADVVASEGRVNVFMSGNVGSYNLGVTCKNVLVDFARSTVRVQKVDCKVSVAKYIA